MLSIINVLSRFDSSPLSSSFGQANYSAMKLGTVGMAYALALEGAPKGILSNVIAPNAATRMTETIMSKEQLAQLSTDFIAPLVAFLVSDSNKNTGAVYECGGGWVARDRQQRAAGSFIPITPPGNLTVERVKANWHNAVDFSDPSKVSYPTTTASQMEQVARNVPDIAARNRMSREDIKNAQDNMRKQSDSKL